MRRRKKQLPLLFLSLLSFIALIYMILGFSPTYGFMIYDLRFPILPLFFLFLFLFLYFLFYFIFGYKAQGIIVGLFVITYLLLRLNNLTHPFFALLLLILFGGMELLFVKRK